MKKFINAILGAFALMLLSNTPVFAIEDMKISVACSNVVLSWPSVETETYIVQYRQSLTDTNGWQTLTTSLPADLGTNLTIFVHSNAVQNPVCGGGSSMSMSSGGGQLSLASSATVTLPPMLLAIPLNGSGSAAPLALYPPGVDMSGFLIYDPVTDMLFNSAEYAASSSGSLQITDAGLDGGFYPAPMSGDSSTQPEPETGFYRVVRNGAHLYGMTNGMILSNIVQIPIELGLGTTDEVAGVTFYANGSPLIGASAEGESYAWTLNWDTKMMPNGTYDITAEVSFTALTDSTNTVPVSVTVSNAISFPNYFSRIYGSQMWIYAELIDPVADFQLDMYDENTNYLGSFAGSTSDGVISFLWDLTDGNGFSFDSANFYGVFNVSTTPPTAGGAEPMAGSSVTTVRQTWAREWNWTQNLNNYYVIAYAPLDNSEYTTFRQNLTMLGGGEGTYNGVIHSLSPYNLGAHLSPGNVDQSSAFCLNNGTAKTNLLSYLADWHYRNFYFLGHGSPYAIGGINPNSRISYTDISHSLTNLLPTTRPINYHPYRFVFIDGCSAGAAAFCEAFGIPAQTVNNAFFSNVGVNSRAFLGFKQGKFYPVSKWDWYAMMIGGFYNDWQTGLTVQECVNNAVNGVYNAGQVTMDSSWVIYGAADLRYNTPNP